MIVKEKIGNINASAQLTKAVDWLPLEWHETGKRIMHKKTNSGAGIVIKFLSEAQQLTQGDILFENDERIIAVEIIPCDVIIVEPATMHEMASVCYEIGNKHLPLFYENEALLIPFDLPLFKLLSAQGYKVRQGHKKLLQPLKTTVSPHGSVNNSETIFSRIMKLTASPNPSKGGA